jgi:hypothetical protein
LLVSPNTDGIGVFAPDKSALDDKRTHAIERETRTQLNLEDIEYEAIYARDVNNYMAIKSAGGVKRIGVFAESPHLKKNPVFPIVATAVAAFFLDNVPLEETIRECDDLAQFTALRKATGGAVWRDEEVGKTCRWYLSTKGSPIIKRKDQSRVPNADAAMMANNMPRTLPDDIDYSEYLRRANELIDDVGALDLVAQRDAA